MVREVNSSGNGLDLVSPVFFSKKEKEAEKECYKVRVCLNMFYYPYSDPVDFFGRTHLLAKSTTDVKDHFGITYDNVNMCF